MKYKSIIPRYKLVPGDAILHETQCLLPAVPYDTITYSLRYWLQIMAHQSNQETTQNFVNLNKKTPLLPLISRWGTL